MSQLFPIAAIMQSKHITGFHNCLPYIYTT